MDQIAAMRRKCVITRRDLYGFQLPVLFHHRPLGLGLDIALNGEGRE
jgi:hypothetical protein